MGFSFSLLLFNALFIFYLSPTAIAIVDKGSIDTHRTPSLLLFRHHCWFSRSRSQIRVSFFEGLFIYYEVAG